MSITETLSNAFDAQAVIIIVCVSIWLTGTCMWLINRDAKKYKPFRDKLAKGTKVFASSTQTGFHGVVTSVDGEFVTIETKVRRHRVYPESKKSNK